MAVDFRGGLAAREPLQLLLDLPGPFVGQIFQQAAQGYGALLVPGLRQSQGHAPANLDVLVSQQFPHGREEVRNTPPPQCDCGHGPANAGPVVQGLDEGCVRLAVHHADLDQDATELGDRLLVLGTGQKRQERGHGAWRSAQRQHPKQRFG